MKLAYLANCVVPSRSANSIQVLNMCDAFAANGHDVTLVVPERDAGASDVDDVFEYYGVEPRFEIRTCPRPDLSSLGTFLVNVRTARAAARMEPDLAYGRSIVACYVASRMGVPTVFESHAPMTESRFGRIEELFFRRLSSHSTFERLVVISDALCEYYEEHYAHLDGRIVVARDGASPVDDGIEPASLAGNGDRLQVGYVGSLYAGRGMELIADLAARLPAVGFHVVGGSPEDVARWEEETRDLDNVTFYGFVEPSEVDRYRLAFDVQIAPFQRDLATQAGHNTVRWMSPLKLFEYMAAGRAIVTSDLPAVREILDDGETALLCDPDDVSQWVDALERLADDPDLRASLGRRAKAALLANYTWERRAELVLSGVPRS